MGNRNSKKKERFSEVPEERDEALTRLLLVGKTGVGKSSTGNSILQLRLAPFKTGNGTTAVTSACKIDFACVQGRRLKVVDGPGLGDPDKNKKEDLKHFVKETKTAVAETPDGYDSILIVIHFGRQSAEDKEIVEELKQIFGQNFIRQYGILVLTRGDDFKREQNQGQTFEQWCSNQKGYFHTLWKECGKRVILFDNASDDAEVKKGQIEQLLSIVDSMKRSDRYTPNLFEAAQNERERLIKNAKESVLREKLLEKTRLIMHEINAIELQDPEDDIMKLEEIKNKVRSVLENGKKEGKDIKVVRKVMDLAESVDKAVDKKIRLARTIVDNRREEEEINNSLICDEPKVQRQWEKKKKKNDKNLRNLQNDVAKMQRGLEKKYKNVAENNDVTKQILKVILVTALITVGCAAAGAAGGAIAGVAAGVVGRALAGRIVGSALTTAAPVVLKKIGDFITD